MTRYFGLALGLILLTAVMGCLREASPTPTPIPREEKTYPTTPTPVAPSPAPTSTPIPIPTSAVPSPTPGGSPLPTLTLAPPTPTPSPTPPPAGGNPEVGKALFEGRCNVCHPGGKGGLGPGLVGVIDKKGEEAVKNTIRKGSGMMPGFSLSDKEMADLIAFLKGLK